MNCPHCGKDQASVIDSRPNRKRQTIYRRRECLACGFRWSTVEISADYMRTVVEHMQQAVNLINGTVK